MKKILYSITSFLSVCALLAMTGCGNTVKEGDAALVFDWNGRFSEAVGPGWYVKPFASAFDAYTLKEVAVTFENQRPKAKDDLSLADLDVDINYRVTSIEALKRLALKRVGSSAHIKDGNFYLPAYNYVRSLAESEIADATSKFDSLTIHKNRDGLAKGIKDQLQAALNATDPGDIVITRVSVRRALPDVTVENAIRNVVNKEKEREASLLQIDIANNNAAATAKTANTLTPAYLQHEYNQVLMEFAKNKGGTVVLDGSSSSKILNLK